MEVEREIKTLLVNETFHFEIERLRKDGWEIDPTVTPTVTYHLIRYKGTSPLGGLGKFSIDDSKVFIIPAGQKTQ